MVAESGKGAGRGSSLSSRPSPAPGCRCRTAKSANVPQPGTRLSAQSWKTSFRRGVSSATSRAASASSQAQRTSGRRSTPPTQMAVAGHRLRGSRGSVPPTTP